MRDSGLSVTDARRKSPQEVRELFKTRRALLGRASVKIHDELRAESPRPRVVAVGNAIAPLPLPGTDARATAEAKCYAALRRGAR
jgi:hypothetical protein